MKKTLLFIVALSLVVFACGPIETSETAQNYHSELISTQTSVDQAFVDLIGIMDWGSSDEILSAKEEAKEKLDKAIKQIESMDEFDGKDEYKKEMLKLLSMYEDILKNEISEMIDYITYYEELTDEDYEYIETLNDAMLDKYEDGHDNFAKYQEAFAKEWDFTLI